MRIQNGEKFIGILFAVIVFLSMGFLISLLVIPFFHQEVERTTFSIYISENSDFEKYNFPGSGTEFDPYIIENYTYFEHGIVRIRIYGVNKHFVIRNNQIHAARGRDGISIGSISVETTKIVNNKIYGSAYDRDYQIGIYVYNMNGCYIFNNSVYNKDMGIRILSSSNCVVKNNSLINTGRNIEIIDSSETQIENNIMILDKEKTRYISAAAVYIDESANILLKNNQLINSGIWFSDSSANSIVIQNNTINDLEIGFYKNQTDLVFNSSEIYGQLFLVNCTNCLIYNLTIKNSNIGIALYQCIYFNCSACNCSYNLYSGLYLSSSLNIIVQNGTFTNNHVGSRVRYSNSVEFKSNLFQNNSYGIYMSNSNCTYLYNTFENNKFEDIHIYDY
ncbi:MAG: right-handed parallel beta-helix repeat-containing protein [Promethearchaeota archaeon]